MKSISLSQRKKLEFELINLFDVGMTVYDNDFNVVHINQKAVELLRLPEHLLKGQLTLYDILKNNAELGDYGPNADEDFILERMEMYTALKPYEFVRKRKDGTYLKVVGQPTGEGGFATTYTDVTDLEVARELVETENVDLLKQLEKKRFELEVEKNRIEREATLKDVVLENTSHGISLFDRDLKLVVVNKRFNEILKFPEELLQPGTDIAEMFRYNAKRGEYGDVEDIEACVEEKMNLARQFLPHNFQRRLADGSVMEVIGKPVPMGFVTTYMDVSEIVKAREEVENALERQRTLVEASPAGMGITSIDGGEVLYINSKGAEINGFSTTEEAMGVLAGNDCWVNPKDRAKYVEEFERTGHVKAKEVKFRRPNGEEFWNLLSWDRINYQGKDCVLFWQTDTTEQHDIQDQLMETEKFASLGGLVAGVAHEINTPVGVGVTAVSQLQEIIKNCVRDIDNGRLSKSAMEKYLSSAEKACDISLVNLQNAARLINSFKQVSVDQISEDCRLIKVRDYFGSILESMLPETKKARVTVEFDCREEDVFKTNPGAIAQMITNLIQNAIIHGLVDKKNGIIQLQVKIDPARNMRIKFSDNGVGVPKENLKKILEPFYTTRRGIGGSGLGLNIVHNIVVHKLGGKLNVTSPKDSGLAFEITLPEKNDE
ncbi:PAS domain-containing protein [Sneathiella sp. P13V-1]|uniref:PAS-domain containing protein n=1 Tax=Sneathiella sp. P13V-1 TaxID=2697366 RepID=UPI00187B6129|nr:PAS-domain containing protein [Sneathiella sp. P13V-1]MBE7636792.1 PAS domain-containing protein [Sneathiella sp. P13V-1]